MTATIIDFPSRPADRQRLASVALHLTSAIPLPGSEDIELSMLLATGGKLLDSLTDYQQPNCSGLVDDWLDRLDQWEAGRHRMMDCMIR